MKSDTVQRMRDGDVPPPGNALRGVFRRGKPTRELFLVKLSFWAVVLGFILLVVLILWGLATHGPSQFPFDSGD